MTKRCMHELNLSHNNYGASDNFGDNLQLIDWILDSGATCNITPQGSNFIPRLLDNTDIIYKLHTDITSWQNQKGKHE